MAIKSVSEYLDNGGHVCENCDQANGELGKCKQHTRVHTIRHMGFWRWLKIAIKDPVWTVKRNLALRKNRKLANQAIEKWISGETKSVDLPKQISMLKRK